MTSSSHADSAYAGERMKYVLSLLLFRIVLDVSYVFYLSPNFEWHILMPMPIQFTIDRYLLSYVFLLLPAFIISHDKRDFSGIFFLIAMMFIYIPMTSVFGIDSGRPIIGMIAALIAVITALFFSKLEIFQMRLPKVRYGASASVILSLIFIAYFVAFTVVTRATENISLDLTQIYTFRQINADILDQGIFSYLNLWAQKVFNPLLFAIGLYKKNKFLIFITLTIQLYFFAVTQHRVHLAIPILIYMIMQLYIRRLSIAGLVSSASVVLLAVLFVSMVYDFDQLPAITIRRAFFVAGSATFEWISYFSDQPKVYWTDNFLSGSVFSQYNEESLPHYVGYYISAGRAVSFNVGIIGAGFAQAGLLGVFLYAAVLGLIVQLVNAMIRNGLPTFMAAALLAQPIRAAWADNDLFSALLSHGILIGLFVLWLYGSQLGPSRAAALRPA